MSSSTRIPASVIVIGMHGLPRSGKDTAAFHLATGRGFTRFSFAVNLREELQFLDPFVNGTTRYLDAPESLESQHLLARMEDLILATGGDQDLTRAAVAALNPYIDGTLRHTDMVEAYDGDWDAIKADPALNGEPRDLQRKHGTEVRRNLFGQDYWLNLVEAQITESGVTRAVITDTRFPNEGDFVKNHCNGVVIEVIRNSSETGSSHASDVRLAPELIDVTIDNNGTLSDLAKAIDQELFDRNIAFFPPILHAAA
jgi:hypothetical protein